MATDWMSKGFCVGAMPEIFSDPDMEETAKAYCDRCPVRQECLDWALTTNEEIGVWGGASPDERKALKRGGPRRTCPGCGRLKIYSDGRTEICLSCGLSWLL